MSFDEDKIRNDLRVMAEQVEKWSKDLSALGNVPGISHLWFFRLHEAAQKGTDFAIALRQAAR